MLPAIALMIGAYLVVRFLEIASDHGRKDGAMHMAIAMLAVVGILVAVICCVSVFTAAGRTAM